jgi:hypothetical protein
MQSVEHPIANCLLHAFASRFILFLSDGLGWHIARPTSSGKMPIGPALCRFLSAYCRQGCGGLELPLNGWFATPCIISGAEASAFNAGK